MHIYSANRPSTRVMHEPPTRTCPSAPTCTFTRPIAPDTAPLGGHVGRAARRQQAALPLVGRLQDAGPRSM